MSWKVTSYNSWGWKFFPLLRRTFFFLISRLTVSWQASIAESVWFYLFSAVDLFILDKLLNDQSRKKKNNPKLFICAGGMDATYQATLTLTTERAITVKRKLKHPFALWRRIYSRDVSLMVTSAPFSLFERLRRCLLSSRSAALLREWWGNGLFLIYLNRMRESV